MSGFNSLDLEGRACALGISCREYVRLGTDYPGIYAHPMLQTDGAVARLRRWHGAGCPTPDLSRLEFCGSDAIRAIVVGVLRRLPAPVAWHAIEFVSWIEVGRAALAWQGTAPIMRAPDGDQAHIIAINGHRDDDDGIAGTVAHEIGHSWGSLIRSPAARTVRMPHNEAVARMIVVESVSADREGAIERLVRAHVREERLADDLARLWGFERNTDYERLARHFRNEHTAATDLADQIERDIERDVQGAA